MIGRLGAMPQMSSGKLPMPGLQKVDRRFADKPLIPNVFHPPNIDPAKLNRCAAR